MKRAFISVLAVLSLLVAPMAKAENITLEQAKDIAAHYLQHNTYLGVRADNLTLVHQLDNSVLNVPSMYFLNAPECGWIIIGGTTVMDPIIAFTDKGSLDPTDFPPAMAEYLRLYNDVICAVQEADAEKGWPSCQEWDVLAGHRLKGNTKDGDTQVQFLETEWNQGEPDGKDYSMYTPKAVSNYSYYAPYYYCPAGCVATALAQICNYYQFPKKATGNIRLSYSWPADDSGYGLWEAASATIRILFDTMEPFDYSVMPAKIRTQTNKRARSEAARLSYYVGLAVMMDYAPDGSSSNAQKVYEGMPAYFKYQTPTFLGRWTTTSQNFIGKMRAELKRGRPLYMDGVSEIGTGRDAGGHAWVCSGYMTNNESMYYLNWGWGGKGNGYFNVMSNTQADMSVSTGSTTYAFNQYQGIMTGLIPPADSVAIETVQGEVTLGVAYPNPATYSVTLPYSVDHAADLVIYNALGQAVETHRLQAGHGDLKVRVDGMPAGIYIYRMGDAYGKFIVR